MWSKFAKGLNLTPDFFYGCSFRINLEQPGGRTVTCEVTLDYNRKITTGHARTAVVIIDVCSAMIRIGRVLSDDKLEFCK